MKTASVASTTYFWGLSSNSAHFDDMVEKIDFSIFRLKFFFSFLKTLILRALKEHGAIVFWRSPREELSAQNRSTMSQSNLVPDIYFGFRIICVSFGRLVFFRKLLKNGIISEKTNSWIFDFYCYISEL